MDATPRGKPKSRTHKMTWEALQLIAARFRALGEPIRLRILQNLESGEIGVTALAAQVGSTQPNISKHLKVLQEAGLIKRRQIGTRARYSIADEMVFELCEMVCSRLRDRLTAQAGTLRRSAFTRRRLQLEKLGRASATRTPPAVQK